jgi:hypothetical protein
VSVLSIDDQITLTEILVILLGIAFTWAIYYRSDAAELPGEARVPDPSIPDDPGSDLRGRSLQ